MTKRPVPRVYIDTNVLIYIVEGIEPFRSQLGLLVEALDAGGLQGVTSDLTIAEVMVKPFARKDQRYITEYSRLLSGASMLEMRSVDRTVLEHSAKLRAEIGGKLADGIHVATAELAGCSHLVSEDSGIKVPEGMALIKVREIPAMLASLQSTA